jgi:hypothetical protein
MMRLIRGRIARQTGVTPPQATATKKPTYKTVRASTEMPAYRLMAEELFNHGVISQASASAHARFRAIVSDGVCTTGCGVMS